MVNVMNVNVLFLKNSLKNNPDFIVREIDSGNKEKIYVVYFESLVNSTSVADYTVESFRNYLNHNKKIKKIKPLIVGPKISDIKSDE